MREPQGTYIHDSSQDRYRGSWRINILDRDVTPFPWMTEEYNVFSFRDRWAVRVRSMIKTNFRGNVLGYRP